MVNGFEIFHLLKFIFFQSINGRTNQVFWGNEK